VILSDEVTQVEEVEEETGTFSHVRMMSEGEVFAARAMLTQSKHSTTTRAHGHIELLSLSNDDLLKVLHQFPEVYQHVYQHAVDKYQYTIK